MIYEMLSAMGIDGALLALVEFFFLLCGAKVGVDIWNSVADKK